MRPISYDHTTEPLPEPQGVPRELLVPEDDEAAHDFDASGALERLGFNRPSWALIPGQRPREFNRRHELSVEDVGVDAILENADDDEDAEHLLWLTRRTFENRGRVPDPVDDPFLSVEDANGLEALRASRTTLNKSYLQRRGEMRGDQ